MYLPQVVACTCKHAHLSTNLHTCKVKLALFMLFVYMFFSFLALTPYLMDTACLQVESDQ